MGEEEVAMTPLCLKAPAWYHAATLTERIASLRTVQRKTWDGEVNAELAGHRMQRWRSQLPFRMDAAFAQRFAAGDLSEDQFLYLLGEPIKAVRDRFPDPPTWLAELAQAFSRPIASNSMPLQGTLRGQEIAEFLSVIEPLISQGRDRLHQGVLAIIQDQANLPFDPATVEDVLFVNLPPQLITMLSRTMALELNVARLQGLLEGETPEARFGCFWQRLRQRDIALALLQEYPVLARQLTMTINRWVAFSLEFLQHLCADWQLICAMFSPEYDPGGLVQLARMSYERRGGRSVQIARFDSGFQIVYKPRPLALEGHFQELLTWLNDRGAAPPFRTLKLLDRGPYGWVECVIAQGCASAAEVRRFYERQGGYLALLYALEAIDLHFDNLIAVGEHPVLIDLETLFQPRIGGEHSRHADQRASDALRDSVLRVGLLPQRMGSGAESDDLDMSGLGAVAGQLTPYEVPSWEGAGTDEMRLTRKRAVMAGGQHQPTLSGASVNVLDYTEAIVTGFTTVYRLLLKHREALLAADGPVARFATDEVRVLLRPTQVYDLLLWDSYHPDMLRDALDRDRLFDWLWGAVRYLSDLAKVIPAEREDLVKGDVPIFTTCPGSRDLWSSTHERIAGFFAESGLTLVKRRVQRLSDDDLSQQLRFIYAALATPAGALSQ
jgi:type 2 lantibiotic biosynthesis protein LanM